MKLRHSFMATAAVAIMAVAGAPLAADTFTYRMLDDVVSFDPQINTDVEGSHIARDLFEGLVNSAPDGTAEPGAAESWEASADGLTYTFKLRDAKWSNGDPVKASDFVYAWRRLADPATASEYAWYMELMGLENASAIVAGEAAPETLGVKALDDKTLEVKIDARRPYFPQMLTHASTFPVNQKVVESLGSDWTKVGNLVGNGAYTLTDYQPGVSVTRERNPMYWNDAETTMDKVVALIINDENIALTRYDAGEIDKTDIPAGQYPAQEEARPDEAHSFPKSCSYSFMVNLAGKNEALKDVRVRQALAYAINRDVIVNNILQGGQYPSYNWTHEKTAGFAKPNPDWAQWTQAERNAKAKELLAEAGYGPDNPLKVTLNYNTSEAHKKIAVASSQMLKQTLGVEMELANYEWKVHLQKMREGDFELARYAWCGDYNEPSTYTDFFASNSGHNNGKFFNDEYDALVAESKVAADPSEIYTKLDAITSEQLPLIPIYQYTGVILVKPDIKGWPFGDLMQNIYSRNLERVK